MEEQKTLLHFHKLSKRPDTVEAIISQMTSHEINQRSDYLESQIEQMDDFDVHIKMINLFERDTKIMQDQKSMFKRIRILRKIVTEVQNQDHSLDGQELTTNFEVEINEKKSDKQSHQFSSVFSSKAENKDIWNLSCIDPQNDQN